MSRSVSTHHEAIVTQYLAPVLEGESDELYHLWDDFLDDIRNILTGEAGVDSGLILNGHPFTGFEGYIAADRWAGREDHVILEGELTEISVSEYGGIVAVCLAPLNPDDESHVSTCHRAEPYFKAILQKAFPNQCLSRYGTMSNGEGVYNVIE